MYVGMCVCICLFVCTHVFYVMNSLKYFAPPKQLLISMSSSFEAVYFECTSDY